MVYCVTCGKLMEDDTPVLSARGDDSKGDGYGQAGDPIIVAPEHSLWSEGHGGGHT